MNLSRIPHRASALFIGLVGVASTALAHPGHDGDHGGGLTWDFVSEVGHRLTSPYHLAPPVILGLVLLGLWRLARAKRKQGGTKSE